MLTEHIFKKNEMLMKTKIMMLAAGLLVGAMNVSAAEVVWIEGESALKTNIKKSSS